MNLKSQKRMAADELNVGKNRVWIDPNAQADVSQAVTRDDIRELIEEGAIQRQQPDGQSRGKARKRDEKKRKGRRTGEGSRRGSSGARSPRKDEWVNKIRAQRKYLKKLRDEGDLDKATYRKFYRLSKGGSYPDVAHLKEALKTEGHLEE